MEDIDALGAPKKDPSGIISFNYYKDLFTIVGKYGRQRFAEEKKELINKRRKALKDKNDALYSEIVKDIITKEE